MNTRIQELLAQAYKEASVPGPIEDKVTVQEKFAEMIVRECIKEIGYKSVELLDIDFYPHYQERLKKHFGVE